MINLQKIPETIDKTVALIILALVVASGIVGFCFGTGIGYTKGFNTCAALRTIEPVPLQTP